MLIVCQELVIHCFNIYVYSLIFSKTLWGRWYPCFINEEMEAYKSNQTIGNPEVKSLTSDVMSKTIAIKVTALTSGFWYMYFPKTSVRSSSWAASDWQCWRWGGGRRSVSGWVGGCRCNGRRAKVVGKEEELKIGIGQFCYWVRKERMLSMIISVYKFWGLDS